MIDVATRGFGYENLAAELHCDHTALARSEIFVINDR